MTSTNEQIMAQLNRLSLVFDPPMAKIVNGEPNQKYAALVAVYVESLQPFQPWELEAGVKLAMESHRYGKWPKPAELRAWCLRAQQEMRPPPSVAKQLEAPKYREVPADERERNSYRMAVLRRWMSSGDRRLFASDGLQQCKTIAAAEQRDFESRLSTR